MRKRWTVRVQGDRTVLLYRDGKPYMMGSTADAGGPGADEKVADVRRMAMLLNEADLEELGS